jgi:hypothetical protein
MSLLMSRHKVARTIEEKLLKREATILPDNN